MESLPSKPLYVFLAVGQLIQLLRGDITIYRYLEKLFLLAALKIPCKKPACMKMKLNECGTFMSVNED